jgi:hypothetical protein
MWRGADKSKNKGKLESFIKHCQDHPEDRFWQALRNWSEYTFIYGSKEPTNIDIDALEDTFYIE